jgi:predicted RNA-binding Zn ribbon-like protein
VTFVTSIPVTNDQSIYFDSHDEYTGLVTSTTTTWSGDQEAKPAPEPLRRVQALVNTLDRETGQDRLAARADAIAWLRDNELLASREGDADDAALDEPKLDDADLALIVGVREALRAMIVHNCGGPTPSSAVIAPLRDVARDGAFRAALDDSGEVRLAAVGDTVRDRLGALLLVVSEAQRDGTWSHLKACANDDCLWAFYDRSRNHGGTWCDMATCGNKLKNRDFRARRRGS